MKSELKKYREAHGDRSRGFPKPGTLVFKDCHDVPMEILIDLYYLAHEHRLQWKEIMAAFKFEEYRAHGFLDPANQTPTQLVYRSQMYFSMQLSSLRKKGIPLPKLTNRSNRVGKKKDWSHLKSYVLRKYKKK